MNSEVGWQKVKSNSEGGMRKEEIRKRRAESIAHRVRLQVYGVKLLCSMTETRSRITEGRKKISDVSYFGSNYPALLAFQLSAMSYELTLAARNAQPAIPLPNPYVLRVCLVDATSSINLRSFCIISF